MRFFRAVLALSAAGLLGGCGYIHFGRLPRDSGAGGAKLAEAYSDLATEHKILKQELVLARKEGDTLRAALERTAGSSDSTELVARLNEASRELATLRASYARLQAERAEPPSNAHASGTDAKLAELEEKLAATLRDYTQLQQENTRLRHEVTRARAENTTLGEQLKSSIAENAETQAALAQLNQELLAQKQARAAAEQATQAVRTQLNLVLAQAGGTTATIANPPEKPAAPASALQLAKAPPADASAMVELRTSRERVAPAASAPPAEPPSPPPPRGRVHVVRAGDTLEKIAEHYYGAPERWSQIYEANSALLGAGQPLRVGMELQVPEN